uniref:hypothetical protein n=1 Tax=Rhizobium sp. F40D2 TaxID=3453141 RepID=UPI003F1EF9DF
MKKTLPTAMKTLEALHMAIAHNSEADARARALSGLQARPYPGRFAGMAIGGSANAGGKQQRFSRHLRDILPGFF